MTKKSMYSTAEVAHILHLSRIEIFRKIKSGKIKAIKVGRNYVIPYESLLGLLEDTVGVHSKKQINEAIDKALAEYGEVFKKLGRE